MPCVCDQCVAHSKTLGLAPSASSKELIHRAYRDAAKQWHPDLFESAPAQMLEAEAHFKLVQVAYRELTAHQEHPVLELGSSHAASTQRPLSAVSFTADDAVIVTDPFAAPAEPAEPDNPNPPDAPQASLSFGTARGCYTAPRLPLHVEKVIAAQLGPGQKALAIIDLTRNGAAGAEFSQFLLLASHGVIVRDAANLTSLIWYSDLGEIKFIDQRRRGKLGFWHRLLETVSGTQQKYALQIYRRNGSLFFRLAGQTDDSVKKVVYTFLLRKKYQPHPQSQTQSQAQ